MARPEDSLIGRTIAGKFAIEAHIGSGAMGQVYRARQIALEKTVALKVLHQDLAGDETFAARFHREAMAASRLDHPNSMRVIDFGTEPDGMLYIAMEFLDGRDLHRIIYDESPLPEARIVDILTQALAALVVAHDMGVVHRDLKPENIMILDGRDDEGNRIDLVKVCDFGIAKISGKTLGGVASDPTRGPLTTQGLVVGTPEYMSPEQGKGDKLDARSDLYSVGVMLFQLLTGQLPFQAETALGLVFKQVNDAPPRPTSLRHDIDPYLESVCLKALAKRPEDRFQSAREMRAALRSFFGADPRRVTPSPSTIPRMLDSAMEHAATVSLPRTEPTAPDETHLFPDAGLPSLPVSQPNIWLFGGGALVVGALIAALAWMHWLEPAPVAARAMDVVDAAIAAPSATSYAAPPPVASTPTARSISSAAFPTTAPGHAAVATAHSAKLPPVSASPADAAPTASGFNLATAAASPTVTHATGATASDVRRALPSWKFTQCYQTALGRTNKTLEGHVTLTMTIDGTGAVTKVGARGVDPLFANTGDCMMEAMAHLSVNNVAPTGGTAEVDVTCTPR